METKTEIKTLRFYTVRDKREINNDEKKLISEYLEKNKKSIPEVLDPEYHFPFPENE